MRTIAPAFGDTFLGRPHDIRWEDDSHMLVAAGRDGTFRLPVAAAPFRVMSWIPRTVPDPKPVSIQLDFNTLIDLDVAGDRLLLLGLQKLDKGKLAADGAIAWTAKLGAKLTELRPVLFSVSGPGARDTDACGTMLGKVRFLTGGFVVVPGGEPGIFVYDSSGKLTRTWQAETVGFDAGCPITEQEMYLYSADVHARYRWLNQRRVVDELLSFAGGIGFVIRSRSQGLTRWEAQSVVGGGQGDPVRDSGHLTVGLRTPARR